MDLTRRSLILAGAASVGTIAMRPRFVLAQTPLNLGYQVTTWGAVGMVGDALKTFEKNGVPVTVHMFSSGVAVRDALVAERIDIGVSSVSSFLVGVDKGELTGIAAVAYAGASNSIMVAAKSDINSVEDLKGKKIATQFGTGSDYTFRSKVLTASKVDPSTLQLVNVKYADHVAALASGSVDAFVGTEPFPAVAEKQGIARTLLTFEKYDIVPVMLAIRRPVLASRRDDVVAFMKGWLEAAAVFQDNPDQATDIVWEVFRDQGSELDKEVLRVALDRLGVNPNLIPELDPYLQIQAETLVSEGKMSAIPDWNIAIDRSILRDAQKS